MFEKLRKYIRKIQRAKRIKRLKSPIAPYLKKDFGVELNYKLWTTKGARFSASHRNRIKNNLSTRTIGYLSAYLIIINLVHVYDLPYLVQLTNSQLGFTTTALSILILLYSQFENTNNYSVKSEKHHQCALEIAELYNQLRMVKTFSTINNKEYRINEISKKYDVILRQYENHLPIDTLDFQKNKPEYFKISSLKVILIKIEKYFRIKFKYHLLIYGPIIFFIIFQIRYI